jgi:hypothetical protein
LQGEYAIEMGQLIIRQDQVGVKRVQTLGEIQIIFHPPESGPGETLVHLALH